MDYTKLIEEAKQALIDKDGDKTLQIARQVVAGSMDPLRLMNEGLIPGIQHVGDLFGQGELFLPDLMEITQIMTETTNLLKEAFPKEVGAPKGSMVIATIQGDIHDIGKGLVVALLRANGYTVHDLGRDVEIGLIIEKALEFNVDVIGTSALLSTTMLGQKELEEELRRAGLRDRFKTIVGGAPVTARWAARIGADAYAEDAQDAVGKLDRLLKSI